MKLSATKKLKNLRKTDGTNESSNNFRSFRANTTQPNLSEITKTETENNNNTSNNNVPENNNNNIKDNSPQNSGVNELANSAPNLAKQRPALPSGSKKKENTKATLRKLLEERINAIGGKKEDGPKLSGRHTRKRSYDSLKELDVKGTDSSIYQWMTFESWIVHHETLTELSLWLKTEAAKNINQPQEDPLLSLLNEDIDVNEEISLDDVKDDSFVSEESI